MDKHPLIIQPTSQAVWYVLVKEAHEQSGYSYPEDLENYLVLTLERFYTQSHFASECIALRLLQSLSQAYTLKSNELREVGDECLMLSGLFPERAKKHHVSLSYYIDAGKLAYQTLADHPTKTPYNTALFAELSMHFVGLMDILHMIRKNPQSA